MQNWRRFVMSGTGVLLLMGLAPLHAGAATHHVPSEYQTMQSAIDVCQAGDSVMVALGTYTGQGNTNLNFGGVDIVLISESGPDETVIDTEQGEDVQGMLFWGTETRAAVVEGFTFTGGGLLPAIEIYSVSSPTILNCIFRDNQAGGIGGCGEPGGIWCTGSGAPLITQCVFTRNEGSDLGGAISCCELSSPEIEDCRFTGNRASNGGAIGCGDASRPTLRRCEISGNLASVSGGGICSVSGGDLLLDQVRITRNAAGHYGGGVDVLGPISLISCTVTRNLALDDGGGICTGLNIMELDRTIVRGNCSPAGADMYVVNGLHATCCALTDSTILSINGPEIFDGPMVEEDPRFCDPFPCPEYGEQKPGGDYALRSDSPCLARFSPCGETIGAYEEGCMAPEPVGACCRTGAPCVLLTEAACTEAEGVYFGDDVSCYPDPCGPYPVERMSWGKIKAGYR